MMFNFLKRKEIERLKQENRELQTKYELQKQAHDLLTEKKEITGDAEVVLDFKKMNVFSIERFVQQDGVPCTLIGYFLNQSHVANDNVVVNNDVVQQWYVYCSPERHAEIVQQYKESLK